LISFKDQSRDEDGDVVSWAWDFGDGTRSAEQNPEYSYSHSGTYNITLIVTDDEGYVSDPVEQTVTVKNTGPMAMFDVIPDKPRVAAETVFDASKAYDADGRVVSYAWDFDGDGLFDLTTASSEATHTFLEAGEVPVVLKVTDDEGGVSVIKEIVEVLPSVIVERTIETCLPGDETIVDGVVTVTVTITINTEIHGLTLHEEIPEGWTFTEVDNSSATFRKDTLDWLFLETLVDGDKRVIQYTLTAPSSCTNSETLTVSLNGLVQSSSPRLSQMVLGDDKVTLATVLPIPVVISRWDSAQEKIDLCLPEQISFDQLQYAVSLWLDGGTVPYTGDQVITLDVIRDLIAYWLTNTSVHDPLP
jgi:PKD repeat protein